MEGWKFAIIQRFFFITNNEGAEFAYFSAYQLNEIKCNIEGFSWKAVRTNNILVIPVRYISSKLIAYQIRGSDQYYLGKHE
jgi:hypothetical protein